MLRLILFLALSAGWAWVSRASLMSPPSHGFHRFFAVESILALILLNFESIQPWFGDPFSLRQIVSWPLLVSSGVLAVLGFRLLHTMGRPGDQERRDEPLVGFERTTRLVTTGIYKYIRHPLYGSLL
jgi:protein-S-isoprenylcysteine O-methyltransferase Ste14